MDTNKLDLTMELAGLTTDKVLSVSAWTRAEECTVEHNQIVFRWNTPVDTFVSDTRDLLLQFARLWRAVAADPKKKGPKTIQTFAAKFGPLWLCEDHKLPMSHVSDTAIRYALIDAAKSLLPRAKWPKNIEDVNIEWHSVAGLARGPGVWHESLDAWCHWSEGLELLLRILAGAQGAFPPEESVFQQLDDWCDFHSFELPHRHLGPQDRASVQATAQLLVRAWMGWGGVRFELRWEKTIPRLALTADSLFGALVAEAIVSTLGDARYEFCTNCQRVFLPRSRRTQPGKDSYCQRPDCRRAISRNAKQRARQSAEPQRLPNSGDTFPTPRDRPTSAKSRISSENSGLTLVDTAAQERTKPW